MELLIKKGEKIKMHIGGKKVIVEVVSVEDEPSLHHKHNLSSLSRTELLQFLDTHTSDSLTGSIAKFEDPFQSPIKAEEWGLENGH